jgi:hypothetical protein
VPPEGEGAQPDHGISTNPLILLGKIASGTAAGAGSDDHDGGGHWGLGE